MMYSAEERSVHGGEEGGRRTEQETGRRRIECAPTDPRPAVDLAYTARGRGTPERDQWLRDRRTDRD
jgi:hypothetical protein